MTKNHITDELLFAYADDELDESQILEVDQYLKSSKIARDKLAEIREVNSYLQDAVFFRLIAASCKRRYTINH